MTNAIKNLYDSKLVQLPHLMLLVLHSKTGKGWLLSELADKIGANLPTITMAKRRLLASGDIKEHSMLRDKRVTKIYLTGKGRTGSSKLWRVVRNFADQESDIRA